MPSSMRRSGHYYGKACATTRRVLVIIPNISQPASAFAQVLALVDKAEKYLARCRWSKKCSVASFELTTSFSPGCDSAFGSVQAKRVGGHQIALKSCGRARGFEILFHVDLVVVFEAGCRGTPRARVRGVAKVFDQASRPTPDVRNKRQGGAGPRKKDALPWHYLTRRLQASV